MRSTADRLVVFLGVALCAATAFAQTVPMRTADLDEKPEKFVPKQARSEAEQNRLEALSLFAAGRIHEQNDQQVEALRLYQRALRYDPDALPILREIIPLAFSLDRTSEAVRYALKAVELDPSDPALLRRLGLLLADRGEYANALALYEKALALQGDNKKSAAYVLLRIEMGRMYYVTEHYKEAAEAFAEAMPALDKPEEFGLNEAQRKALAGEDGRKNLELFAEAFLAAERPDDAQAAFDRAQKITANKSLAAYQRARVLAQKKQPAEALAQLQIYFDEHGTKGNRGPYELLGKLLTELGQQSTLVERLEKITAAEPDNVPARYALARAYLDAGQNEKADESYQRLLKESSTAPEAFRGLVKLHRDAKHADALLQALAATVDKTGGVEVVAEELKPVIADAALVDALISAAREAHKANADRPDFAARLAVALVALEAKRFDVANEFFDLALAKGKNDEAQTAELLQIWGMGLLLGEQYADAARVFQRGVDNALLKELKPTFQYYLAGALAMDGKTDEALTVARQAAEASPDSARIASRVGWVLYHAKRYDAALDAYEALVSKYDAERPSEENRAAIRDARLVLSNMCVLKNKLPQAEEWLEQVLDEYPENISALNDLGYLWVDQGKHLQRATAMIEQAVAAEPENAAYRDSLGWAYYRLGRYKEAVDELNKAAALDQPADGVILDHLGDSYLGAGQVGEARNAWQRAIEAFTKQEDADKIGPVKEKLEKHKEKQ